MELRVDVAWGGQYREDWDETYRLKIVYQNRRCLSMLLRDGAWTPEGSLPEQELAADYFPQAASARVAAERFFASAMTEQDLIKLSPDGKGGEIFAAELLRILMDEGGMLIETASAYVRPLLHEAPPVSTDALYALQPRTAHVLSLLRERTAERPEARHDPRLPAYRSPFGAVRTGEPIHIAIRAEGFQEAVLELMGDSLWEEIPMTRTDEGFSVGFSAPAEPAALWYRFRLRRGEDGALFWLCAAPDGMLSWLRPEPEEGFRLTVFRRDFETPGWFRESVLYQIFPDRFAFSEDGKAAEGIAYHRALGQTPELHASAEEEPRWHPRDFETDYSPDDFYGGRLSAIEERLPELKALGVNCLYLNPIVEARSNHRYDSSDYRRVDPILGTNEDFQSLCASAKELGIRILCDGVFSHTGADSVYFNRDGHYPRPGACSPEPSPYDSWYDFRHFPDDYRSWWGFRDLPEVNELDLSWQDFVVSGENSVVKHWLRLGASGWRLDVADELPDEVLAMIRRAAREEKPDALILGEVWEDAVLKESYGARRRYALGESLDSIMNYPFRTAVLDFLREKTTALELAAFLTSQQLHYPGPLYESLMNLLGSHDVERLRTALASGMNIKEFSREEQLTIEESLSEHAWARAERLEELAFAIQFSVPGVPSIYYGEETGMTGTNDPFNRRPWKASDVNRSDYLARLSARHKACVGLPAGFIPCGEDVLVILRGSGENAFLTVVNRAEEEKDFYVSVAGVEKKACIPAESVLFYPSL